MLDGQQAGLVRRIHPEGPEGGGLKAIHRMARLRGFGCNAESVVGFRLCLGVRCDGRSAGGSWSFMIKCCETHVFSCGQ